MKYFFESLDTTPGHIVILLMLMGAAVGLYCLKIAKAEDILIGSFTALLTTLKGINGRIAK